MYYSAASKVSKAIIPNEQMSITTALQCPTHYLGIKDNNPLDDSNHDTSLLYNLSLEYTKKINMADFLTSFEMCLQEKNPDII